MKIYEFPNPGSYNDFGGSLEKYTDSLASYNLFIRHPELLGLEVVLVDQQEITSRLQQSEESS